MSIEQAVQAALAPNEFRFHYEAEPTLARFHQSDAFIRGIRGPYGCLAADHEVLTRTGWIRIDAWNAEEILVVDPREGRSWFEQAEYKVSDCKSFLHFASRGLDMMVSDGHCIPHFKKYAPKRLLVSTAAQIRFQHERLKAGWDGLVPCSFAGPENATGVGLSDAALRVMVMVCADGSFSRAPTPRCSVCVRKDRKKSRLKSLLVAAGIDWTEYANPARPTEICYRFNAPQRNKSLAAYWQASAAQLRIIAEEALHWDGREDQGYGDWGFYTTERASAEFVAYAFSTCGRRASIGVQTSEHENWKPGYRVSGTTRGYAGMRYDTKKAHIDRVASSDGKSYCFLTSTGFFVTRRNGCICVTGNSGKSVGCVAEIAMRAVMQAPDNKGVRKTRWAAVRNSYPELKSTTIQTFLDWFGEDIVHMNWSAPIEARVRLALDDGTSMDLTVWFVSCDRPADVGKLKSMDLTGLWLNEAGELAKQVLDDGSARVGRFPIKKDGAPFTWAGVIMDTNSMDDDHWWHDLDVGPDDPERAAEIDELMKRLAMVLASVGVHRKLVEFFDQPPALLKINGSYFPNPDAENVRNQPMGMAYWLQLCAGKDDEWIKVYILNEYGRVIDGLPVYSEYKDPVHGIKRQLHPIPGMPIEIGLDFGLSPAAVPCQLSPKGQLVILGELCAQPRSMGLRNFLSDALKPYLANRFGEGWKYKIRSDPAGKQRSQADENTCFNILTEDGWDWEPARTNDFQPRRESVVWFLTHMIDGEPGLLMDASCRVLRKGFNSGYHYRRVQVSGEERYQNEPYDNKYTHPHDALQCVCLNHVVIQVASQVMHRTPDWQRRLQAAHGHHKPWRTRGGRR